MPTSLSQTIKDTITELREHAEAAEQPNTKKETVAANLRGMIARLEALPLRIGSAGDDDKAVAVQEPSAIAPQAPEKPVQVEAAVAVPVQEQTPKTV